MKKVLCPICESGMDAQGPKEWPHWPFCSRRCKMVDLGRWLGGAYAIERPVKQEDLEASDDDTESHKPAVSSADPHRDEA